jgi:hypothetical protein
VKTLNNNTEAFTAEVQARLADTPLLWLDIGRREAEDWPNHKGEGELERIARGVNNEPHSVMAGDPNLFATVLHALDVDALSALIGAGVDVCQWYTDPYGVQVLDPVGHVVQSYWDWANTFGETLASKVWAPRAAACIRLLVDAGASQKVAVWVGPEFSPVQACECMDGIHIQGRETVQSVAVSGRGLT